MVTIIAAVDDQDPRMDEIREGDALVLKGTILSIKASGRSQQVFVSIKLRPAEIKKVIHKG